MRLWCICRPQPGLLRIQGMAAGGGVIPAHGHLPEAGGAMDQSAWLMHAFDILQNAYSQLRPLGE